MRLDNVKMDLNSEKEIKSDGKLKTKKLFIICETRIHFFFIDKAIIIHVQISSKIVIHIEVVFAAENENNKKNN